eukprot:3775236-Prorocentrum_lima.AAC.1
MHNAVHKKWTTANTLLSAYRHDTETQGKADLEGDTEAGARARQVAENKLRDLIKQLADLDAA